MNRDTLISLRDRVRLADGPDREINGDIGAALFGWVRAIEHSFDGLTPTWTEDRRTGKYRVQPPAVTASIDAALALVERCMPERHPHHMIRIDRHFSARCPTYVVEICIPSREFRSRHYREGGLAVLDALLSALIEQEQR